MTDIGEAISVSVATPDQEEDCWYCKQEKKGKKTDLDEDPDSKGTDENKLKNDSSKLGRALGYRLSWTIDAPPNNITVEIVPAAHHLIPGNASLKNVPALKKFMIKGSTVDEDVGYDINCRQNGIWLPGSYGVRENSPLNTKWSKYKHQDEYARRAMQRANAQFHDSHGDYSNNVKKTLRSVANKIKPRDDKKCPICESEMKNSKRPPYGLVGRMNRISRQHRNFLAGNPSRWPVNSGYFTSKRSKLMK